MTKRMVRCSGAALLAAAMAWLALAPTVKGACNPPATVARQLESFTVTHPSTGRSVTVTPAIGDNHKTLVICDGEELRIKMSATGAGGLPNPNHIGWRIEKEDGDVHNLVAQYPPPSSLFPPGVERNSGNVGLPGVCNDPVQLWPCWTDPPFRIFHVKAFCNDNLDCNYDPSNDDYYRDLASPSNIIEIDVVVAHLEFDLLWETTNMANRVFNPTLKDDPVADATDTSGYTFGVPRHYIYLVPDPDDSKYKATVKAIIQPASVGPLIRVALYSGGGCWEKLSGSDKAFDVSGKCSLEFAHYCGGLDIANFVMKVGFDANSDGQLQCSEWQPFVVKDPATGLAFGDPTIRASNEIQYEKARDNIDDIIDGYFIGPVTSKTLPHAKRLLQIFRDGNALAVPPNKKPTDDSGVVSFNAFGGFFSEWLTHNSGAEFAGDGSATLTEYIWDAGTSLANLVACSPQVENEVHTFYNFVVEPIVTAYFAGLPDGSSAYFPSPAGFYNVTTHSSASPPWVPEYTKILNTVAPTYFDDLNGSFGRVRLLNHQVRYHVMKMNDGFGPYCWVTGVISKGEVLDLYDFNHDCGGPSQDAATLQIGFGEGSYGPPRDRGKIYIDRVLFEKPYEGMPW